MSIKISYTNAKRTLRNNPEFEKLLRKRRVLSEYCRILMKKELWKEVELLNMNVDAGLILQYCDYKTLLSKAGEDGYHLLNLLIFL